MSPLGRSKTNGPEALCKLVPTEVNKLVTVLGSYAMFLNGTPGRRWEDLKCAEKINKILHLKGSCSAGIS